MDGDEGDKNKMVINLSEIVGNMKNGTFRQVVTELDKTYPDSKNGIITFKGDRYGLDFSIHNLYILNSKSNEETKKEMINNAKLIELNGYFTIPDTESFKNYVIKYLVKNDVTNFLLDMKQVGIIDSHAIGCIIALVYNCEKNVKLYIFDASEHINGVFSRVGFSDPVLETKIYQTDDFIDAYTKLREDSSSNN